MEAMSAESTSQQISTLWACSNAAPPPEPKCFSKNIPRGIFEDRRDTGGGVVSATPPLYLLVEDKVSVQYAQSKKPLKFGNS